MKIGLPRILLQYHKFNVLFEIFLKELNVDYIYSDETNKKIMEDSLRIAEDEICIPCKLAHGHSLNLKDKCDKILIARIVSLKPRTFTCPKFMLLPELMSLSNLDVMKININLRKYPFFLSFLFLGLKLDKNIIKIINAYNKAINSYKNHIKNLKEKRDALLKEDKLKIAVLGHPYLLYDKYLNLDILNKRLEDVNIFTLEMADEVENLPNVYWSEEREVLNSAYYFVNKVDGIILLTSFLCGTESLIQEFIFSKAKECKTPCLNLIIDENMSEIMLETRINAFLNMIKRKNG